MKSPVLISLACLTITLPQLAFAGGAKDPQPAVTHGWEWTWSAGPSWHRMGRLEFTGGSRSPDFALPSLVGGGILIVPPIGDASGVADRSYLDGYVRQDAGTAEDGSTWYWGYVNPAQVQGDSLVYHARGFESIRSDWSEVTPGRRSADDLQAAGISLRANAATPWSLGPFRVGAMLGFSIVSDSQSYRFGTFQASQTRDDFGRDYQDTYALEGVVPPAAPYAGGLGGPGPLIWNIPSSRSVTSTFLTSDSAGIANEVVARFENQMLAFAMGGSLDYRQAPWSFSIASGLLLEVHHYSASQTETLGAAIDGTSQTLASWSDRNSGTKVRPGLFAELAARRDIGEDWFVDGFLRGEVAESFSVAAGPSRFEFEPLGFSLGIRLGRSF